MSIVEVRPEDHVRLASAILREAWSPPCLDYSPEYLAWQFSVPSKLPCLGVTARSGRTGIGFAATTPRRVRFGYSIFDLYVVSFVAVTPGWRGRGLVGELYAVLLRAVRRTGAPLLTFAQEGSRGQRVLEGAYRGMGFHLKRLASCDVHAYLGGPRWGEVAAERGDAAAIRRAIRSCQDGETVWGDPDEAMLCHYDRDPRPRAILISGDRDEAEGVAFVVAADVRRSDRIERIVTIESLFARSPSEQALLHLCSGSARLWGAHGGREAVVVSNPSGVEASLLARLGVRRSSTRFVGYVAAAEDDHPLLEARRTNVEII